MVITLIKVKPTYIQHFNEHNFRAALTGALETVSEVDDCMLFARNNRGDQACEVSRFSCQGSTGTPTDNIKNRVTSIYA